MASATHVVARALLTVAAMSTLSACRTAPAPAPEFLIVPTATVAPADLQNTLVVSAEFAPFQDIDVMAKVAGYVRSIRVDIGSHVRRGEVLAVLDVPEIQDDVQKAKAGVAAAEANVVTAQAAIQHAQAASGIAHLSFERISEVAGKNKGLVPRQDVDVARSRDAEASALLASAQSSLLASEQSKTAAQSEYARANAMLQYATISAPFDGVVTKRYANTGAMVQAGISSQTQAMPVIRLAQVNVLRLTLPVPVSEAGAVRNGQPVEVYVLNPSRIIEGKITRYADSIQMATRTMDTQVDVRNDDGTLLPGMYAEVHLHLADRHNVLSVPLDAVDGLGTAVEQAYVVRSGVVHVTQVTTGLQSPTRLEILSGLRAGDQVVVGRHSGLSEGQTVQAREATYENSVAHL